MPYLNRIAISASEERLEQLIEARLAPGADQREIDDRIWDLFGEQWAVMFTDLSGFSRGVAEFGIIHFLQVIHEAQRILVPCIDRHDGILLKSDGDSLLVIFRTAHGALACSLAMQRSRSTTAIPSRTAIAFTWQRSTQTSQPVQAPSSTTARYDDAAIECSRPNSVMPRRTPQQQPQQLQT